MCKPTITTIQGFDQGDALVSELDEDDENHEMCINIGIVDFA